MSSVERQPCFLNDGYTLQEGTQCLREQVERIEKGYARVNIGQRAAGCMRDSPLSKGMDDGRRHACTACSYFIPALRIRLFHESMSLNKIFKPLPAERNYILTWQELRWMRRALETNPTAPVQVIGTEPSSKSCRTRPGVRDEGVHHNPWV